MNTLLQIRVMAYTPDPSKIEKILPALLGKIYPNRNTSSSSVSISEIINDLANFSLYLSNKEEKTLQEPINRVLMLHKELEKFLSNWEPSKATTIAIALEEALLELETIIKTTSEE